jgi:hypothetical protein
MLACHRSPFQMESRPLFANASHKKGIKSKASDPTVKRRTLHLVSSIKTAKILRETARRKPKEAIQNTHRHCKDRKDTAVGKRCRGRKTKGQRTRTLSNGHLYAPFYISFCFTAIFSAINKDDGCIGRP